MQNIKSYTLYDLGMNVYGEKFLLPFDITEKDESILEKTIDLLSNANIYERQLFTDRVDDKIKINEWNNIEMKCLYEGNDDYYPFTMVMEVFRYKKEGKKDVSYSFHDHLSQQQERNIYYYDNENDEKTKTEVKDGQWMVSLWFEQEYGGLLEELIEIRSLPSIIKKLNLKKYSY